jgi:hypothetical protein
MHGELSAEHPGKSFFGYRLVHMHDDFQNDDPGLAIKKGHCGSTMFR